MGRRRGSSEDEGFERMWATRLGWYVEQPSFTYGLSQHLAAGAHSGMVLVLAWY